ncbi:MAG: DoxX-like family protein [Bacteroidetes bacterium]|nr:MAG: DoxX-like family protein [Bacteroidota bacterium]
MKNAKVFYWIFTILIAALMLFSAIPNILVTDQAVQFLSTHLGFPKYFIFFIGLAKLLGVIVILIPGFPRLKEWAYAGLSYDLIGAIWSSRSVGDPIGGTMFIVVALIVLLLSYYFYHKKNQVRA